MMSFVTNNKHARRQCAFFPTLRQYFDSLVQDCSNPIASALGLLLDFYKLQGVVARDVFL